MAVAQLSLLYSLNNTFILLINYTKYTFYFFFFNLFVCVYNVYTLKFDNEKYN